MSFVVFSVAYKTSSSWIVLVDVIAKTVQNSLPLYLAYVKLEDSVPLCCIVYVLLLFATCRSRLTAELENSCPFREVVYLLLQQAPRRMLSKRNSSDTLLNT